jgi:hypothetical protein
LLGPDTRLDERPCRSWAGEVDAALSQGGLQKIKVKDIDPRLRAAGCVARRLQAGHRSIPSRSNSANRRIPARAGSAIKLEQRRAREDQVERGQAVQEEFAKELQKSSTFQVASDAGPTSCGSPRVLDLYVSAPDVGPGRTRTLVSSAGEMTLVAELRLGERPGAGARRRPA